MQERRDLVSRRSMFIRTACLYGVIVVGTLVRLLLAYKTPVSPNTNAVYDDALLMNLADSLRLGEWLGPYGQNTLVKNPGYSAFLALFRLLGLRYQLGFCLLLVLACAVSARALKPLVSSRWIRCALYLILLYMPAFFSSIFFQRVYRNGIAIVGAMLVFSSFVGMYLRKDEQTRSFAVWSVLAGISLGSFSLIQESASWVLPFALACTAVTAVSMVYRLFVTRGGKGGEHEGKPAARHIREVPQRASLTPLFKFVLLLLPFALYWGFGAAVGATNASHYGVSLRNNKYEGAFARATSCLMSIDAGYEDDRVWVSLDAMDAALAASPTLKSMEPEIRDAWKVWAQTSAGFGVLEDKGQILGDHTYWALRNAYAEHGGYVSAAHDEAFWNDVANELEDAMSLGTLKRKEGLGISQTTQRMPWSVLPGWLVSSAQLVASYAWADLVDESLICPLPNTYLDEGTLDAELAARDLLGPNTLFKVDGELYVDKTADVAQPWLVASNRAGTVALVVYRVLLVAAGIGLIALLVMDVRRRSAKGIHTALILAGYVLSAYVLVFCASWMISFLSEGTSALDAANPAFSYCGAVYGLFGLGICLVIGRVAQELTDACKRLR